jgi:hypothetical protein
VLVRDTDVRNLLLRCSRVGECHQAIDFWHMDIESKSLLDLGHNLPSCQEGMASGALIQFLARVGSTVRWLPTLDQGRRWDAILLGLLGSECLQPSRAAWKTWIASTELAVLLVPLRMTVHPRPACRCGLLRLAQAERLAGGPVLQVGPLLADPGGTRTFVRLPICEPSNCCAQLS